LRPAGRFPPLGLFRDNVIADEATEDLDGCVDRQGREHAELSHLGAAFRAIARELVLFRRIRRNIRVVGCHNDRAFFQPKGVNESGLTGGAN